MWVNFALLDPDPDCESGFRNPNESGPNAVPDLQHWYGTSYI